MKKRGRSLASVVVRCCYCWDVVAITHACPSLRRWRVGKKVGGAILGWSCFGASNHGPVSFRRVGQSVDLPAKARRWGRDLRGSRQSGCLKPWNRPPQPRRTPSLTSGG
jgi:hypothetical protein